MVQSTCVIDDCERVLAVKKTGLCGMHTYRLRVHGTTGGAESTLKRQSGFCSVAGCSKQKKTLGLCAMHYGRRRRHGDVGAAEPLLVFGGTCSVTGCGKDNDSKGMCKKHYGESVRDALVAQMNCVACGDAIDYDYVHESGHRKKRNARVCGRCPRQSVGYKWRILRARDGDSCHLCDDVIDFSLKRPEPLSRSVDHIVPVSQGGSPDVENLRLAHLLCNMRRRTRPVGEARLMLRAKGGRRG